MKLNRLVSEYMNDDMTKHAKVWLEKEGYRVSFRDNFGSTYNVKIDNLQDAENYAEDWVLKDNGENK